MITTVARVSELQAVHWKSQECTITKGQIQLKSMTYHVENIFEKWELPFDYI